MTLIEKITNLHFENIQAQEAIDVRRRVLSRHLDFGSFLGCLHLFDQHPTISFFKLGGSKNSIEITLNIDGLTIESIGMYTQDQAEQIKAQLELKLQEEASE